LYRSSHRLSGLRAPQNQFSILLAGLRAEGRPLLDLTVSNPTEALASYPHNDISKALGWVSNFLYQPDPLGNRKARQAIAAYLEQRVSGLQLSPDHIALTASTSEGYSVLFKLLADPGDEVLIPTPSYPLFDFLAELENVKLRPYKLAYDGSWFIDFASLEANVSERSRALILVNPNNPTGSFLHKGEFARLRDFVLKHHLPVISDEVFMEYALGQTDEVVTTLMAQHDFLTFTLNGLSKCAGMPQMKLGWITINGPQDERHQAMADLELILDTYLSVGAPVQLAAERLLIIGENIKQQIRTRVLANLQQLDQLVTGSAVTRLHSQGGWSAILRVPQILSEEQWITRLLLEQQIIVQPGYFFDMPGDSYLVVSLLTDEKIFAEGIQRILSFTTHLVA
jgi:aspartate/methionine/tyrosine aminotransferase